MTYRQRATAALAGAALTICSVALHGQEADEIPSGPVILAPTLILHGADDIGRRVVTAIPGVHIGELRQGRRRQFEGPAILGEHPIRVEEFSRRPNGRVARQGSLRVTGSTHHA